MPRKKKDSSDADVSSGEGTWKWTAENDRTLFLLTFGRVSLGKPDYEKIAAALSPNVNWNGVRQRIGKFRSEQKKVFEHLGWDAATETPAKRGSHAAPRKRKGIDEEREETPVKAKKGRVKKGVVLEELMQHEEEGADRDREISFKEEDVDEGL